MQGNVLIWDVAPQYKILQFNFFLIGQKIALIITLTNKKKVQENLKVLQCERMYTRGLVRNSNPRVPLHNMRSILGQVLLVLVGFIT